MPYIKLICQTPVLFETVLRFALAMSHPITVHQFLILPLTLLYVTAIVVTCSNLWRDCCVTKHKLNWVLYHKINLVGFITEGSLAWLLFSCYSFLHSVCESAPKHSYFYRADVQISKKTSWMTQELILIFHFSIEVISLSTYIFLSDELTSDLCQMWKKRI